MRFILKIILPAALLTLLSLGTVLFSVFKQAGDFQHSQLYTLTASADSVIDRIDRCLFERYGDVQAYSLNPLVHRDLTQLDDRSRVTITGLLNDYAAAYGCYPITLLTDLSGKVVAINTATPEGKPLPGSTDYLGADLSGAAWFQQVKAGHYTTYQGEGALTGTYVEEPGKDPMMAKLYGQAAPAWTMSFSAPIRDRDGHLFGYWHNVFTSAMLETIVLNEYQSHKVRGLPSTEFAVSRQDGLLLIDVDPAETGKLECRYTDVLHFNLLDAGDELAQAAKASTDHHGTAEARSARMKIVQPGGFARSVPTIGYAGSGFTVFIRAEPSELFALVQYLKTSTVIIALVTFVVGGATFLVVLRPILKAITSVNDGLNALAGGDLRDRPVVANRDETGQMSTALGSAVKGMREAIGQEKIDWAGIARQRAEVDRLSSVIENAPINIMVADLDMKLVYVNPASRRTLKKIEPFLPVKVEQVLGSSIDIFHQHPAHQRALLGDTRRLPHRAQFAIGTEIMELTAAAITDQAGKHIANMVAWDLITEKVAADKREKQLADNLRQTMASVSANAQTLAAAAEELSKVSQTMSANSEETTAQANVAAAAAEQVSKNVETVATSAEEMSATVREIAKSAAEAARVGTAAVKVATDTNATVTKLGDSSNEVGKVIKVITSIAEQTNLLALNATIEAARAGEAGKGFAVVANEVKELAKQTAAATEDISAKIQAIQTDTHSAVGAIGEISKIIAQINNIQNTIASAVEEQSATTNEIARNATEAAKGSTEISGNISGVSQAAQSTSEGAANTLTAAGDLARLASDLKKLVDTADIR